VLYFAERLREQSMRRDAFVVNRVHPVFGDLPAADAIARSIDEWALPMRDGAGERLRVAAEDESRLGRQDALHLFALEGALEDEASGGSLEVRIPAFPYDIYELTRLSRVSDLLAPPPAPAARG
jgi:hypothetical protein